MISRRGVLGGAATLPFLSGPFLHGGAASAASFDEVTLYEAARIITMEPARPACRFVAVAGGIVLGLGDSLAELEPWTRGRMVRHDRSLAGNVLLPGLIDPHLHPMQAAVMLNIPFIAPDEWQLPSGISPAALTPAAYRARLKAALAAAPPGPYLTWGYHELFHGPLGRADLDAMAPGRQVLVWQRSFHEIIVSTAMLESWGVTGADQFAQLLQTAKADPAHGDYQRGMFTETALLAALAKLRPLILGPGKVAAGMQALQRMMLTSGVTTASDMATGIFADFDTEAGLVRTQFERSGNPSRMGLMPLASQLDGVADLDGWLAATRARFSGAHVGLQRRVKLLADGAFFAQNMRMNPPGYIDGHAGRWITPPEDLHRQMQRYWQAGFSLHIHVNGDEGLDAVLDGAARLERRAAQGITLEHLGYSTEAQNRRIAQLGLMVSAQPNYIRVLGEAYSREGLGPGRAEQINRLGSLERKGVPLGLHSDFNMAPVDPLYLAWIAANRIGVGGTVMAPAERLSLDKALRAITIEAAQVIGMDAQVGSIAPGKRADFAVLNRNPHALGAARLREVKVAGVVFEGRFTAA